MRRVYHSSAIRTRNDRLRMYQSPSRTLRPTQTRSGGIRSVARKRTARAAGWWPAVGSIFRSYNACSTSAAGGRRGARARAPGPRVVTPDFLAPSGAARTTPKPDVGVVGGVGAIGCDSIDWWGGGRWTRPSFINRLRRSTRRGEPRVVLLGLDGQCAALAQHGEEVETPRLLHRTMSPWAVPRKVRFEDVARPVHGYRPEFCLRSGTAGRKVVG